MTTPSPLSLRAATTALLVIDVQERLASAMPEEAGKSAIARTERLVEGARILGLPVLVTEQYPKGLGPTVPSLKEKLDGAGASLLEKLEFDATENEGVRAHLERWRAEGRTAIVLAGMEAHICVYQTARGLSSRGFSVHVAFDAVCSREKANVEVARSLYHYAGAWVSTSEVVLFDLVGKAGSDTFKAISKLVR
ncbi:MAG: isochorismatase family protein [Sandaracinaceae bacterium]|nr:isochorismatase family protein [Sandaracinaceae bacterium]